MHEDLIETLRDAQRFGFFGGRPIEQAIEHSSSFIDAIGNLLPGTRLIDIGSGGGLPGLLLADHYGSSRIALLDRREKRTDFLRLAVARLGWSHVEVITGDVDDQIVRVASGLAVPYDIVTARGFGPPSTTLRSAARLIGGTGRIVISEPPERDRWPAELLDRFQLHRERAGPVSVFTRR